MRRVRSSAEDEVKGEDEHGDVDTNGNGADGSLDGGNRAGFLFKIFGASVEVDQGGKDEGNPEGQDDEGEIIDEIGAARKEPGKRGKGN